MKRLLILAAFLVLAAPLAAVQQWGVWAPGLGAFGHWAWGAPAATVGALPAGGYGCRLVIATGAIYCWDGAAWTAQGGGGGVTDHGALTGLGDDDHSQYALLAGRPGQTLVSALTGNASTATALAANGGNCSAGQYALGVDAGGAAESCTADDDVPEAGDFGTLALTGDVTSSGLATTVAADSVALGTDTTGGYAASATEGGAATTATALAADPAACTAQAVTDIAANGTLTCSTPAFTWLSGVATTAQIGTGTPGAGKYVDGATGAWTAIPAGDAPAGSGSEIQTRAGASTLGAVTGSSSANGGMALVNQSAAAIPFSITGAASQSGSYFSISDSGAAAIFTVASTANGQVLIDAGGANSQQLTITARGATNTDPEISSSGRLTLKGNNQPVNFGTPVNYTPQSVACASTGNASLGALTVTPSKSRVHITNSDPDGCTITIGESMGFDDPNGVVVELVIISNAGGTVDFADTSGVSELAGAFSAGVYDSLSLAYISDRWVETGRSNN